MTKHSLLFVAIILLLLYSCDNSKEQELSLREADLNRRVQLFKAKEAEYFALLKMRDSLQYQDSIVKIIAWPEGIAGLWNSRIVCVETNCSDYIIGDIRNDLWEFTQDSTQLLVNVYNKKDLIRIYDSKYTNDQIALHYATDTTAQKFVNMNVYLSEITPNKISGYRTVSVNGRCTAKFTVELNKIPNQ